VSARALGIPLLGSLVAPPLVLAYHALGHLPPHLDPHHLMVTPERFREQIDKLRARGYAFVPLTRFGEHVARGQPPSRTCALTFDDGSLDNLAVLAPLLVELELPATVFACPGLLGAPHFAFPGAADVRLMNPGELRELAAVPGVDIGSHTVTHVDLHHATAEQAEQEMRDSRVALEDLLQHPVESFAYPRCGYSAPCPEAARAAGYRVAVTCGGRGGWRPYELSRESIDTLDGHLSVAVKSRRLFWPLRDSAPGRVVRRARHRSAPT
jgi:peptidoglycan/xylan/chitin deacetylase (PgdA/CDA1 family)